MPELPEVEAYRRIAERALDREISTVQAPDAWFLKRGIDAAALGSALVRRRFTDARRRGKLLLLDTDTDTDTHTDTDTDTDGDTDGPVLGLRFGMTGRLLVDGAAGVDDLIYSSNEARPEWERFGVTFADGGRMGIIDPRRLGGVELDPDEDRLGPDAWSITPAELRAALTGSDAPLKARLMDQARIAGVGNLIADEAQWRTGLLPHRPAGSLDPNDLRRLHRHLRNTIDDLIERGGSHQGDFLPHREAGGACPRDGTPLERATVGGRTTWWCPSHQR